jgi:hypothetical protein
MRLRDHPNLYSWPPEWVASLGSQSPPLEEWENLILKKVEIRPIRARKGDYGRHIWITAEYRGKSFFSTLTGLVDPDFLDLLYQKLNGFIGQTIREIGDSDWED